MKLKKWLATILAVTMAFGALGAFAACGEDEPAPTPPGPQTPAGGGGGGDDDTAIQYYLVGSGLGTLASNNWDQTTTEEALKFTRTGNTAVITADLYEGDEFAVVHNQAWDGQMGMNVIANGGKDAEDNVIFEMGGGYEVKNIKVAEGQSGKYKLTLTINDESSVAGFANNSITWECLEKYEVVFAEWYDTDDTTLIKTTVVLKNSAPTELDYVAESKNALPRFYEFKNWVTKDADGETETEADFTQAITESVKYYARIGEVANAEYEEDTSTWKLKKAGADVATFAQSEDYECHNYLIATYEFEEDDTFTVTNGTVQSGDMTMGHASFFKYEDGTFTVKQAGNYQFILMTEVSGETVTVKEFIFKELIPTYTGYAVVGDFAAASWKYVEGVNAKMVETEPGSGTYTATITIDEIPAKGYFGVKVAKINKNNVEWSECYGGSGNNADSDGNYKITETGTYRLTVNPSGGGLVVLKLGAEYYIVGQVEGAEWTFAAGVNPKLEETEPGSGIYTATITMTEANKKIKVLTIMDTTQTELNWNLPNWGAEQNGSCISGGDWVLETAGTYLVTLNINTNVLTVTLQS